MTSVAHPRDPARRKNTLSRFTLDHLPVDDARSHGRFGSGSWHQLAGASMSGSVQRTAANDEPLASTDGRARTVAHPARITSAISMCRMTVGNASAVPSAGRQVRPRLS
jgi:hypothetical protein